MTHEELLAKINDVGHSVEYGHGIDTSRIVKQLSAIRAVVELHKPVFAIANGVEGPKYCQQCAEGRGYATYPCLTIETIIKELT